jgi:hypothetical protein
MQGVFQAERRVQSDSANNITRKVLLAKRNVLQYDCKYISMRGTTNEATPASLSEEHNFLELLGSKRRGWQSGTIIEIRHRNVLPSITNIFRGLYPVAPYFH